MPVRPKDMISALRKSYVVCGRKFNFFLLGGLVKCGGNISLVFILFYFTESIKEKKNKGKVFSSSSPCGKNESVKSKQESAVYILLSVKRRHLVQGGGDKT